MRHKAGDPVSKFLEVKVLKKEWTPATVKALCEARGVKYQAGDEDNIITFIASSQIADREGDIVMLDGLDCSDYLTNPVFMWVHDLGDKPPLGAGLEVTIDKSDINKPKLLITVLFQQVQQFAREVCELYKLGYLKAVSIGFRSKINGLKFPTEAERSALGMRPGGLIFIGSELYELSGCPVGMNQEALKVRSWSQKTIALLKGENPSNIESEDINMTPDEVKKAITDAIPEHLKGIDFSLLTLKAGDKVTGAHIQAMHDAHAGFSKALAHMAAAVQEHPIVPDDSGARGPKMSDKCSKSLSTAISHGTKALIQARSVAAAHEPDPDTDNDDDTDKDPKDGDKPKKTAEALEAFRRANPKIYGEAEKSPLEALHDRLNRT